MRLSLLAIIMLATIAGCATTAPIPMGTDTYLISQTSAGGVFKAMSSLKSEVIQRANAFAESRGKVAIPLASKESPAYPGHMPNFEYQFRLVDKSDPRASGAALVPTANVVIEQHEKIKADLTQRPENTLKPDLYTELTKLDDLRKRGIINDAEFDAQKKKLLDDSK